MAQVEADVEVTLVGCDVWSKLYFVGAGRVSSMNMMSSSVLHDLRENAPEIFVMSPSG